MRIIDADSLKEKVSYQTRKIVDQEPTAYDVDKVVEELENELHFYENRMSEMGGTDRDVEDWGAIKRLKDAIEIVKAGGKNETNNT